MDRPGFDNQVKFFYGTEVEHTPAFNKPTLFVVGLQPVDQIAQQVLGYEHIYFGANMSYPLRPSQDEYQQWADMVEYFLERNYWCTLDMDVSSLGEFHDGNLCEYRRFIPMISVKLPYTKLFNYNTVIKIDDRDFEATNPGVWCHRLHDLMDPAKFTDWDRYTEDKIEQGL
jgi:hypothetical protein